MAVETSLGGPDDGKDEYGPHESVESTVPEKDLAELVGELDGVTAEHRAAIEKFLAKEISGDDLQSILTHINNNKIMPAWAKLINRLIAEYEFGSAEFINATAAFMTEFDVSNIEFLRKHADVELVPALIEDVIAAVASICTTEEFSTTPERLRYMITEISAGLIADTSSVISSILSNRILAGDTPAITAPEHTSDAPKARIGEFGRRAVEAVTITIGVAGGIILASAIERFLNPKK